MAKKRPKPESGGARMTRKGYIHVSLGLTADEAEAIDAARGFEPRTKFIVRHAVEAARKGKRS